MSQAFLIFSVSPANQANAMAVRRVAGGNIDNTLPAAPTAMTAVSSGDVPMLIVYDSSVDTAQGYTLDAGSTELTPAASFKIGTGWDIIEPYLDSGVPSLMCYRSSDGTFAFFRLVLPLAAPVTFSSAPTPGTTRGYTTVKPFVTAKGIAFLAYNQVNGSVAIYSSGPAKSPPTRAWSHQWARGWTRFALFQFGGETFFLKINVVKLNVNIDHVCDALSSGTIEVGTNLQLESALDLTLVEPFTLPNGDPHFITYKPDGTTTVNRFNGNCLGWTQLAAWNSRAGAAHIVPFRLGADMFVLVS